MQVNKTYGVGVSPHRQGVMPTYQPVLQLWQQHFQQLGIILLLLALAVGLKVLFSMYGPGSTPTSQVKEPPLPSYFMPDKLPLSDDAVAALQVPKGFKVTLVGKGLENAGMMALGPKGTLYVVRPRLGSVVALKDMDGDHVYEQEETVVLSLPHVSGIALQGNQLYLATTRTIFRGVISPDGRVSRLSPVINGLPQGGQHPYRYIAFGPDGYLYISIGSYWNAADEPTDENAAIIRVSPDARHREVFASGLRHTIGLDWHPQTHALWGMEQGTDWNMADIPPEELNEIAPGRHYGYPWCFGQRQVDPLVEDMPEQLTQEQFCNRSEPSRQLYQAHSSPTGFHFYRGKSFPDTYRHSAFVTMYGSSHRKEPVGYKVVRVSYGADGRPAGFYDFMTGFLSPDGKTHFGRPYGIIETPDGALLVSDEASGAIYRVEYKG